MAGKCKKLNISINKVMVNKELVAGCLPLLFVYAFVFNSKFLPSENSNVRLRNQATPAEKDFFRANYSVAQS
jgi:hypothetical protein